MKKGEIAEELYLSPETIETCRSKIKQKMGLASATERYRAASLRSQNDGSPNSDWPCSIRSGLVLGSSPRIFSAAAGLPEQATPRFRKLCLIRSRRPPPICFQLPSAFRNHSGRSAWMRFTNAPIDWRPRKPQQVLPLYRPRRRRAVNLNDHFNF